MAAAHKEIRDVKFLLEGGRASRRQDLVRVVKEEFSVNLVGFSFCNEKRSRSKTIFIQGGIEGRRNLEQSDSPSKCNYT